MPEPHLRPAVEGDAGDINAIYAPYVLGSVASFEYDPPGAAEMARRMLSGNEAFPWLVAERAGRVVGYAYAGRVGERRGYDWSAALSVYIDRECRRGGAGRALYNALEALLRAQGYRAAYALVAVPNPDSEAFHQRMGYVRQGLMEHIGYKFGRVAGVAWYAKALLPVVADPPLPRPFTALQPEEVAAALAAPAAPPQVDLL